jgi:exportin-7
MFEMMYQSCMPLFTRALDTWWDDPAVTVAVLKFWMEIAENKDGRISFDAAFPGGMLLFKEMAASITAYGRHLLAQGPVAEGRDAYKLRYKGIGVCLASMALALTGQYVAFGAFTLYGDTTVDEVVSLLTLPARALSRYIRVWCV